MKKTLIQTLFFIIALSLCGPLQAHALLWNYTGSSQVIDIDDGSTSDVQVSLTMSDRIMGYGAGAPVDPYVDGKLTGNMQYIYPVSSWQMDFAGGPTYQGNDGGLFGFGITPPGDVEPGLTFDELYLSGGPVTASFEAPDTQLNYDHSEWDFRSPDSSHYAELGPVILLSGLNLSNGQGPLATNNGLFLTRGATPVNPVPEPLTIVLMGIGVAGVVGRARRRQAKRISA